MSKWASLVVSPHLDDAALSASARLLRGPSHVVTVFAGMPRPGIEMPYWDRLTGASDVQQRMAERYEEDEAALRMLGATTSRLSQLDRPYRVAPLQLDEIAAELRPFFANAAEIWLPAGIGGNFDHFAVRKAAFAALSEDDIGADVFLYADFPYIAQYGWPACITGDDPSPFLDTDYWLRHEMALRELDSLQLTLCTYKLDVATRRSKAAAISAYRSQLPALGLDRCPDELVPLLSYEASWRVRR